MGNDPHQFFMRYPSVYRTRVLMENLANDTPWLDLRRTLGRGLGCTLDESRTLTALLIPRICEVAGVDIRPDIRRGAFSPKNARAIWAATTYIERRLKDYCRPNGGLELTIDSWIQELGRTNPSLIEIIK